jgi:hypothetical protein
MPHKYDALNSFINYKSLITFRSQIPIVLKSVDVVNQYSDIHNIIMLSRKHNCVMYDGMLNRYINDVFNSTATLASKFPTTAHHGVDFKFMVRPYVAPTPVARIEIKRPYSTPIGPGSVVGIATGYEAGRYGDRIPVGGEIFRTCPDRP